MKQSPANSSVSRRHFLARALQASAVGAAFPTIIPRSALAAPGIPGANDRIGIGFIGMGRRAGELHQELLRQKTARVVAVADVNLKRAEAVAAKHQAKAMQHYRKLLEMREVDAVITATPEHWRGPICIETCQAGKDIYAEKPLTLTIREGRLMVQAARKYNRIFQTGSQQRSMWANQVGCEMVRSGKFGKITRIVAHNYPSPWECGLPGQPVPEGLDWELWCGPTEVVPYNQDLYLPRANPGWLSFRPYSGGEMTGWGAHGFDQVQCALGMDETGPLEVWVEGPKLDSPKTTASEPKLRGDKICSQPKVFFRYPGDIIMELGNGPMGGAIFEGTNGKITIDRGRLDSDPTEIVDAIRSQRPKGFNEGHLANWLDCIKTRKKPIADVEIGHRSSTVCHLGNIARWVGRKLRWDPVKEVFPDDSEANQYLDRARRKGYDLPAKI